MIHLRSYQENIIQNLRSEMVKGHKNIVLQSPTGSGKTVVFSFMVKSSSEKNMNCMILTDRIELLEQAGGTFEKVGINYSNITSTTKVIPNKNVLVAMVETIKRRIKKRLDFQILLKRIDIIIIDECHKITFDEVFQYVSDSCYVIGVTATPIRLNKNKPLSKNFTSLVLGPSIPLLIEQGYLSKPEYYGVSVDLSKIKIKAGEFDDRDMEKLYTETKLFSGLKENIEKHAKGLKTMIFCPSVDSSKAVAKELNCFHIDGTMSMIERHNILHEFENVPGSILTNCAITTTGYDHPDIKCIILYRATTSLPLYLQMIGRGSRTTETKTTFIILDFGMNVQRFGYWHTDRTWSLDVLEKKTKSKKDVFPVKFCPQCSAIMSVNKRECEYCGFIWVLTEKERLFAELEKLTYTDIQKRISEAKSVDEMEQLRIAKGYKVGYLLHKFKSVSQFKEYERIKGYKKGWANIQAKRYLNV